MRSFETRLVEAVKQKRQSEGLSLRALATIVGVSFSTLARIERGQGLPDNNSKIRLLGWLGSDATEHDLTFENVAFVHFRAAKNVRSRTVKALLRAAENLKKQAGYDVGSSPKPPMDHDAVSLSKEDLERAAEGFRKDLGLDDTQPLDPLRLSVEGVKIAGVRSTIGIDAPTVRFLSFEASDEWSAMSVPLDPDHEQWIILLNDSHTIERQRVTMLEEIWHILLGHKLTKIAKVAEAFGRTYDSVEEHDAYYLASATLLPRNAMTAAVAERRPSTCIAQQFGTSRELVDYRMKRLGLWRDHVGKQVTLG